MPRLSTAFRSALVAAAVLSAFLLGSAAATAPSPAGHSGSPEAASAAAGTVAADSWGWG